MVNNDWLVVWNMAFMTFHILGIVTPTDELIFFRGVDNHQPDYYIWIGLKIWEDTGYPKLKF
jgi:hypothetical protein